MAARVNTKLLVILIVGLGLITSAVVGLGYWSLRRSPERFIEQGNELKANGDWPGAATAYSKAVHRDQGNVGYILLWMEAMQHTVPSSHDDALKGFQRLGELRKKLTQIEPGNVELHRDWLDHLLGVILMSTEAGDFRRLATEATLSVEALPPGEPGAVMARRYRGIANANRDDRATLRDAEREQTREDLEAALNADPDDSLAAASLVMWRLTEAQIQREEGFTQRADKLEAEALEFAKAFAEEHPEDARAKLSVASLLKVLTARKGGGRPDLAQVGPVLTEGERLAIEHGADVPLTLALVQEVITVDPQSGSERALRLLDASLQAHPEHPALQVARAEVLRRIGRNEEAFEVYGKLIGEPKAPLGIESVLAWGARKSAAAARFEIAMDRWERTPASDSEAAATARQTAIQERDRFATMTAPTDAELLYMDGRVALREGRAEAAATKFEEYRRIGANRTSPQFMLYSARALLETGQIGAAYDRLAEANQLVQGRHAPLLVEMAQIDVRLRRYEQAAQLIEQALRIDPENAMALDLQTRLAIARGEGDLEQADPVLQVLADAQQALNAQGHAAARTVLERGVENHPDDARLYVQLVRLVSDMGDRDAAADWARRGLAVDPEHETLRIMEAQLTGADLEPVLVDIAAKRPNRSPIERLIEEARLLAGHGLTEAAKRRYDEAIAIDPNHPELLEIQFVQALRAEDWARARQFAEKAAQLNADQAEGSTFFGRLQLGRGEIPAALSSLTRATEVKPWDGLVWRYLAIAYWRARNWREAERAFVRSIELKPDDPSTHEEYSDLLVERGDYQGALESIREARRFAPNDPRIHEKYLELEGLYGDRDQVIRIREARWGVAPQDVANAIALARLHALEKNFERAGAVLNAIEPTSDDDRLAVARARAAWHAEQGDVDAGRAAIEALLAGEPSDRLATDARLAVGAFLVEHGRADEAEAVYRAARATQDPVECEADRALGEYYLARGDFDRALEHLQAARRGNPENRALSLRLIDVLQRSADQRVDPASIIATASELLENHLRRFGESVETALLQAKLAELRGRPDEAAQAYDRAVSAYPNDVRPYLFRAAFNVNQVIAPGNAAPATDPNIARLQQQINRDLERAGEIAPSNVERWMLKGKLAANRVDPATGERIPDVDGMIEAWRGVLQAQPDHDDARLSLIEIYVRRGEFVRASTLVREALQRRPDSALWEDAAGDLSRIQGDQANVYLPRYRRAYELDPTPARLLKFVEHTTTSRAPSGMSAAEQQDWRRRQDEEALELLSQRPDALESQPLLQILRGRLLVRRGRTDEGRAAFAEALKAVRGLEDATARQVLTRSWFDHLSLTMPLDDAIAMAQDVLGTSPNDWERFSLAGMMVLGPKQGLAPEEATTIFEQGMASLESLREGLTPGPETALLQLNLAKLLGGVYYSRGEHRQAADAWSWGLEAAPMDAETNNNLAYVLADNLNDPAAALEPARRAAEARPSDASILDTYGYVLMLNDRLNEAESQLRRAVRLDSLPVAHRHLAQVLIRQGREEDARVELERGRQLAHDAGDADEVALFEDLQRELNQNGGQTDADGKG